MLPLLLDTVLGINKALCMQDKHSVNEAAFPAQHVPSWARKGLSVYSLILTDLTMRLCLCMAIYHMVISLYFLGLDDVKRVTI